MDQTKEILSEVRDLVDKTARIETHIEYQKKQNERIEKALISLEGTKEKVEKHEVKITGFSWILGLFISLITAKVFGKF